MKSHFTDRVAGRTALASALLNPSRAALIQAHGLLPEDLQVIKAMGEEAEKQDRLQREDLATQKFALDTLANARNEVDFEADDLRVRLPAVHLELAKNPATIAQASWLAAASFERFRLRLVSPVPTDPAVEASSPVERTRVARTDRMSRALAVSQLTASLLSPEHAPIVDALAKRGFPQPRIEALSKASKDLADKLGGKISMEASRHTQLEADAVAAQHERWKACQRMIAKAAQSDPELAKLWAAC
jgi:hypothetical protein